MTRINVVEPWELCDQHLLAEYRELPRVFGLARPLANGEAPANYTMGKGHVKFFYNKLEYLYNRQLALISELKYRSFNVKYTDLTGLNIDLTTYPAWNPGPDDMEVNRDRIIDRLRTMKRKTWTNREVPSYARML